MKSLARLSALVLTALISLMTSMPARAVPPLPSSFYGTVKVNGANVPDGTLIQALVDGQVYAEAHTQTYQGDSVYALDVPGDDSDSTATDGGREGDVIQFLIGGVAADQAGSWHSATNVNLDLSASSSVTLNTPEATYTPLPTQTAIAVTQASPTGQASPQASMTSQATVKPPAGATAAVPPAATQAGTRPADEPDGQATAIPIFVAAGVFMVVLIILTATRKRKSLPPK